MFYIPVPHRSSSTSCTKAIQNLSTTISNSSSPSSTVVPDPSTSQESSINQDKTSKYPQIQTPDIAAHLAAVASNTSSTSNITTSNGYSEPQSQNNQTFSKHIQRMSQGSSNVSEDSSVQDRPARGKPKTKTNNNGNHSMDNYSHVRNLSTAAKDATSKEALDFKIFAENLIRKNMSSINSNRDSSDENDTTNITLKSLLSNVNTQEIKFMERFQAENLGSEIEILKAKNRELQLSSTEKDRQLQLYQKQVDILKNTLSKADKVNKEQARTIESLKESLLKEMERFEDTEKRESASPQGSKLGLTLQKKSYSNYISEFSHGRFKEKKFAYKGERHSKGLEERMVDNNFAIYERGGVTITPVNCGNNKTPNGAYDLKGDSEYENNGERYTEELATIEPVIEMNCSDEEDASSREGEDGIQGVRSPDDNNQEECNKTFERGEDDPIKSQEHSHVEYTMKDQTTRT